MKRGIIKRIIGCAAALALVAGLSACGSEDTPTGQVTKGPVDGADVFGTVNGVADVLIGRTDSNGKFQLNGEAPFRTSGGKYVDLATGVLTDAPVLKASAGAKNITPITTLIAENPTDTALLDKIKSLGIAFDDPLTTVTAENKDAIALSECIGAAMVEIKKQHGTDAEVKDFLTSTAAKVKDLTVASGSADLDQIETKMKEASSASLPAALSSLVSAKLHATYLVADNLNPGDTFQTVTPTTPTTGTTGGSSNGVNIK